MTKPLALKQTSLSAFFGAKKVPSNSSPATADKSVSNSFPRQNLDGDDAVLLQDNLVMSPVLPSKRQFPAEPAPLNSPHRNSNSGNRPVKRQIVLSDDEYVQSPVRQCDEFKMPAKTPQQLSKFTFDSRSSAVKSSAVKSSLPPSTPRVFPETPLNTRFVSPASTVTVKTAGDRRKERMEKFTERNEEKYGFLLDIRDADGRRCQDPEYDPRSIYIPKSFWRNATPFERQYWEIKCKHFDTVVFFKKGKFFELFERDADLGSRLFDLKLTDRGHMRMVGVPEASFNFWASKFIAQGYKVAKVDQMESMLGKEMRERERKAGAAKGGDDIVRRELTAVLTGGTLIDGELLTGDSGNYCLAVKEVQTGGDSLDDAVTIGVCFVDSSTGEFFACSFADDSDRSVLATLLVQVQPREVLFEKSKISQKSFKVLKDAVSMTTIWNGLKSGSEFWDAYTTWEEMKRYIDELDTDENLERLKTDEVASSAFGAVLWYLQSLKLDSQLIGQMKFSMYDPIKGAGSLVLDGQTLINLEVFETSNGDDKGTLFHLINQASTPFGKRLLRRWLCHPLMNPKDINARLDCVDFLLSKMGLLKEVANRLSKLPDLERLLSRIQGGSCKLKDFLLALDGFETLQKLATEYYECFDDCRLHKLLSGILECDLMVGVDAIKDCFDVGKAKSSGEFVIKKGVEDEYDSILAEIHQIETDLDTHLHEQKRIVQCGELKFRDIGKELFQIEVPSKYLTRVPHDWLKRSATKAVSRFHSPFLVRKVRDYQEAVEKKSILLQQLYSRVLKRCETHVPRFRKALVQCAEFDCLLILGKVSNFLISLLSGDACRPTFSADAPQSFIRVKNLRHPCVAANLTSEFVANDLTLGGDSDDATMILLTGPNMGGKSTMLRQTCIAIIMAQLGCYVPATECQMTPFDRIFTRIGANDNIMAGQSTFMVEMSETSRILNQATAHSLVILDELGRGSGTFDGFSIAFAVLYHLAVRVRCLGLFATHYGLLASEFSQQQQQQQLQTTPQIRPMFMNCIADNSGQQRDVVFLYKLIDGVSPKSYGMNVAHMAGIPDDVVDRAETKAASMVNDKGWIGNVSTSTAVEIAAQPTAPGANILLQSDFERLLQLKQKPPGWQRDLKVLWKSARSRFSN